MAEPPYGVIWNRLKVGKVVPFLGAGASFVGRPPGAQWDARNPVFLPSGRELSNLLATETSFPSTDAYDRDNLAKVTSYYADLSGRRALRAGAPAWRDEVLGPAPPHQVGHHGHEPRAVRHADHRALGDVLVRGQVSLVAEWIERLRLAGIARAGP